MAGYQPNQNGIYISPDVHIPPGMTAYPMQPPTIPRQQQMVLGGAHSSEQPGYPAMQQQNTPVIILLFYSFYVPLPY
jgi:hypothetical protein